MPVALHNLIPRLQNPQKDFFLLKEIVFFNRKIKLFNGQFTALQFKNLIFFNLIFMQVWGHVGIALASSIAAWVNAGALAVVLKRRGQLTIDDRLAARGPKIALASAGMAVSLILGERLVFLACAGQCTANIPALATLIIGSMILYAGLAHVLGAARWSEMKALRWLASEDSRGS